MDLHPINEFILKRYGVESKSQEELPIILPIDRRGLVKLFRKLGYLTGAEIGVLKGRFSKEICRYMPKAKLYCIDAWLEYDRYLERRRQDGLNNAFEQAKARLAPYNCELIKGLSMDVVKGFKDESLDFVFIDGNHTFEYVVNDIAEWTKKVKIGGIVSGHDYWNSIEGFGYLKLDIELFIKRLTPREKMRLCQVKDAVLAWTNTNKINPWYVTGADDLSCYFWVREW